MEIFAGFVEHADVAGRPADRRAGAPGHPRQHALSSTSSATTAPAPRARTARSASCWRRTTSRTRSSSRSPRWTGSAGSMRWAAPKTDNMYHAGWAWAGNTPFKRTKLVASHFGGTRNPMVISWPKGIKPDKTPRPAVPPRHRHRADDLRDRRHHAARRSSTVSTQDPIDGVSLAYTFGDAEAADAQEGAVLRQQRQPRHLPGRLDCGHFRAARALGCPARPALPSGIRRRTNGSSITSARISRRPTISRPRSRSGWPQMQKTFLELARANKDYPIGAGIWLRLHPEDRIKTPYTSWRFDATTTRMPEFTAPGVGRASNTRDHRRRVRRERLRRALRARRRGRRAQRSTWTRASSSTNTT